MFYTTQQKRQSSDWASFLNSPGMDTTSDREQSIPSCAAWNGAVGWKLKSRLLVAGEEFITQQLGQAKLLCEVGVNGFRELFEEMSGT
jgi:hypothetical protein